MMGDQPNDTHELRWADISQVWREREIRRHRGSRNGSRLPRHFGRRLGRETIHLDTIAFRILTFLAATPYRAYSRRRIAEAVSSRRYPVAAESLDQHIRLLREQLGFFRDYVQTVPYVGYRFKA